MNVIKLGSFSLTYHITNGEDLDLTEKAKYALRHQSIKVRVKRSGMIQLLTFTVKKAALGNISYTELYTDRLIDVSEILRVANEIGLPVEAKNGHAFPKGTSAQDFIITEVQKDASQ